MAAVVSDPTNLKGKVCVVTGAARGIGAAIAEVLAAHGANVVLGDLDPTVTATAEGIAAKYGVKAVGVVGNVAKSEDALKLAEAAKELGEGKIWGIVNNAGITKDTTLKNMTEEQWDAVLNVNLKGCFLVCKHAQPFIQNGGSIVNISSIVGKAGNFGQCNYAASKAGIIGFTKSLAKEMARAKVRVNAIEPGFISTPMTAAIPEKVINMVLEQIPFKEMGKAEDIANAVLYLVCDMSKYVTGSVLEVAGGMFM